MFQDHKTKFDIGDYVYYINDYINDKKQNMHIVTDVSVTEYDESYKLDNAKFGWRDDWVISANPLAPGDRVIDLIPGELDSKINVGIVLDVSGNMCRVRALISDEIVIKNIPNRHLRLHDEDKLFPRFMKRDIIHFRDFKANKNDRFIKADGDYVVISTDEIIDGVRYYSIINMDDDYDIIKLPAEPDECFNEVFYVSMEERTEKTEEIFENIFSETDEISDDLYCDAETAFKAIDALLSDKEDTEKIVDEVYKELTDEELTETEELSEIATDEIFPERDLNELRRLKEQRIKEAIDHQRKFVESQIALHRRPDGQVVCGGPGSRPRDWEISPIVQAGIDREFPELKDESPWNVKNICNNSKKNNFDAFKDFRERADLKKSLDELKEKEEMQK